MKLLLMDSDEISQCKEFNKFIEKNKQKTFFYLKKRFSLSDEDIEDIYQDSSVALFENIQRGKFVEKNSSIYSYFLRICINQSISHVNKKENKTVRLSEKMPSSADDENYSDFRDDKIDELLLICSESENDNGYVLKDGIVREAMSALCENCKDLLWSFYVDDMKWEDIAFMYSYSNANSAKSTAYRCRKTFKEKYEQLIGLHDGRK